MYKSKQLYKISQKIILECVHKIYYYPTHPLFLFRLRILGWKFEIESKSKAHDQTYRFVVRLN